jgi:hypothetical protein
MVEPFGRAIDSGISGKTPNSGALWRSSAEVPGMLKRASPDEIFTRVNGCFAWTGQAPLGIGHCRCLCPACKAAEYRRGPSNFTRCVD